MTQSLQAQGQCLCKTVTLNAKNMSPAVGACHCGMCRTWSGGPLLSVDCGKEVTLSGQDAVGVYDSSPWAERGFCKRCGTHLFYRMKASQQYYVPVGLFKGIDPVVFSHQIFIDKKPSYYTFSNTTQNMTEAEVFAKYGQG